jgi:hypothetical protein
VPPLPDPTRGHEIASCLGCGYSLSGLRAGGRCPECGLVMPDPERSVRLFGLAKSQERRPWRRACWVAIGIYGLLFSQGFMLLLMWGYGWLAVFGLFVLVASIVAMLLTGTSSKSAVECFAITTAGLGRSSPKGAEASRSFEPWRGSVEVEMRRVGAVWYKIRLYQRQDGQLQTLLEAGVRCPDADREWVYAAIRETVNTERATPVPTP